MTVVKSLWPNDVIWRHRSGAQLAEVMACFLLATSHCLVQFDARLARYFNIPCIRAISQRMPKLLFCIMSWRMILLRLLLHLPGFRELTHWGRVTHTSVGNLTIIGSDNGLSPDRRQTIIRTNVGILLIWPLGTNCSDIVINIPFTKMHLKRRLRNGGHFVKDSMY